MTPARRGLDLSLYVITDPVLGKGRTHGEIAEASFAGGAGIVQLRDKGASTEALYRAGLHMQELAERAGAAFVVNDRLDVAQATGAGGAHVGQDDLPAAVARGLLGKDAIVGVSVENGEQAREAERDGATYVAVGPIYEARGSKADAGPPVGPDAVAEIKRHVAVPVVAIGGINHDNAAEVVAAGADGLAVMTAIIGAPDVAEAARRMRCIIDEARSS